MAKAETDLSNKLRVCLSPRSKLFRNHVGLIKDQKGRMHRFGLVVGSCDTIGWTEIEVTAEMVGQKVAVFTAVELKTGKAKPRTKQRKFMGAVRSAGGIAFWTNDVDDGVLRMREYLRLMCSGLFSQLAKF